MQLADRHFPARIAELGFHAQLPADWISHELPTEDVDFSDPSLCVPLAIVTAPHAAIVFAFAARPAYDDGTLHDWAWFLLHHNEIKPNTIGPSEIAGVPAVVGEAGQESELGTMMVRFAFLEDGGRLINLSLSAPEMFADTVRSAWFAMLGSFALETPKGSQFSSAPQGEAEAPAPTALMTAEELASLALAADASSLSEEHPMNARLRTSGAGLVPRIASVDLEGKSARVAAGAVEGIFRVPLGWHVMDDGRRTLVFDAEGRIQVNLNLRAHEGESAAALGRQLLQQYLHQQPDLPTVELNLSGIACAGVRGVSVGQETLDQFFLVRDVGRDGYYVVARVSATGEDLSRALSLAGDILATFETGFQSRREARDSDESDRLSPEGPDRLEDVEREMQREIQHIGVAASIAEMYSQRMRAFRRAGNEPRAIAAFQFAVQWMETYAGWATSGGEGEALSYERDQFHAALVREFGYDPTGKNS